MNNIHSSCGSNLRHVKQVMLNIITCFMLLNLFAFGWISLCLRKCAVILLKKEESAATATTGYHHNTVPPQQGTTTTGYYYNRVPPQQCHCPGGTVFEKGNTRYLNFYKLTKAKSTNKVSNVLIL